MMIKNIDPTQYWQQRHQKTDLATVGYIGLGLPFNYWMYRVREKVFDQTVLQEHLNLSQAKILDIGSGSGFYINRWRNLKAKNITASDFSSRALKQIKKSFRKLKTLEMDITLSPPKNLGQYDIISAFDILYHILDDKKYDRAINNIYKLLKPDGVFIFSENLTEKTERGPYQVSRSQKTIFQNLKKSHFQIEQVKPIFYLMNAPLNSQNRLLKLYWFLLNNALIRFNFLGHFFGPLLFPWELLLVINRQKGTSTNIIVCRKLDSF